MDIKDIEIIESLGQDFYNSFNKFIWRHKSPNKYRR